MNSFQGLFLGILQGIAEFLPISSSGHLQVVQTLFGLEDVPLLFDVFLHLATLAAVCLYFWPKIWNLLKILGRWIARKQIPLEQQPQEFAGRKTIIALIISTAITGVLGLAISKIIPEMPVTVVCTGFIVTAILLIVSAKVEQLNLKTAQMKAQIEAQNGEAADKAADAEKASAASKPKSVSIKQSIIIGLMQGFGTLPGISRSGSTIAGALFSGVDRDTAGDYSFIVSIPAILGAFILELKDLGEVNSTIGVAPVLAGCLAAFAVGYFSLATLMKIIKKGKLQWFAAYLIPVGILGIIFF